MTLARTTSRLFVLALCFVATAGFTTHALRPEVVPPHAPLSTMPVHVGAWTGQDVPPFAGNILAALGVDEYLNRLYFTSAGIPVSLYVGYYSSQRTGDTIHSPQNCLPGAGWLPVHGSRVSLTVPARAAPILVNRMLIQKGLDRQVVLYWYQSHGRVVASDYWSKVFLVYDALRHHRSDASLVRVISPVMPGDANDAAADARAQAFVAAVFPDLDRLLPL
jgi:EpsI family protein